MDTASVEVSVATSQDGNDTTTVESADAQAEVSSYTVNPGGVWENAHRPLPPAQPCWWREWAF